MCSSFTLSSHRPRRPRRRLLSSSSQAIVCTFGALRSKLRRSGSRCTPFVTPRFIFPFYVRHSVRAVSCLVGQSGISFHENPGIPDLGRLHSENVVLDRLEILQSDSETLGDATSP